MASEGGLSIPARVLLRAVLNIVLVWVLAEYFYAYFELTGGLAAYVIVGSLLTLMNLFIRPLLEVITMPIKLFFATLLAIIIVNGVFVELTIYLVEQMQDGLVTLEVHGRLWGWVVVATILGTGNWLMKIVLNAGK
ncbi:MAG TPA: phage holin family protein [Candidatus Peribacteraceae bacterium]|nr:phage holin family protein [Candidatus Peribacteraceae bacterium]